MSVMEKELMKVQGEGATLGKKRVRSIAYANNIAILSEEEEMLMRILKEFQMYMTWKGLKMSTEKSMIMSFKKAGRRKKDYEFFLSGKRVEVVKCFTYPRYEMKENNKEGEIILKEWKERQTDV